MRDPCPRCVPLLRGLIHVALPEDHPLCEAERVRLQDLRDARWIGEPRGDCHVFTIRACAQHGFDAHVDVCSSHYAASMELLRPAVRWPWFRRLPHGNLRREP